MIRGGVADGCGVYRAYHFLRIPCDWLGRTQYVVRFGLLARRLRKRTVTTQCPRMALPFPPHSLHALAEPYAVRSLARAGLVAAQREESKAGSPCPSRVPSQPFAVPLPCFCHVQDCMVETYLTC